MRDRLALPTAALCAALLPSSAAAEDTPGLVPLDEATQPFQMLGEPGLYPGGANEPTGAHAAYGDERTAAIVPRAPDGSNSADGFIGFVSIGLSNTNQEWSRFERDAEAGDEPWSRVTLIDAAQGGVDARAMQDPDSQYWDLLDQRIVASGLSPQQIQVVWLKQSQRGETGVFPDDHQILADDITAIVGLLEDRFVNLQAVYLSSRVYGGYIGREPWAYATAFSVKWAIERQVDALAAGDPDLGPFLAWGPYLWANGACPRGDGLTWELEDFENGGFNAHTALPGEQKVGDALRAFFASDPRAVTWYGRTDGPTRVIVDATADAHTETANPDQNFGAGDRLLLQTGTEILMRFPLDAIEGSVIRAELSWLVDETDPIPDATVHGAGPEAWDEATVTANTAPPVDDAPIVSMTTYSRGAAPTADVTGVVAAAVSEGRSEITLVLRAGPDPLQGSVLSRETTDPPRLVVIVDDAASGGESGGGDGGPTTTGPDDGGADSSSGGGDDAGADAGTGGSSSGCGCDVGTRTPVWAWTFVLALAAIRRRR